jgi:hypothetical protein
MLTDTELWETALDYHKRAKDAPKFEVEVPLMQIAAVLLVAFELRRVVSRLDGLAKEVRGE